MLPLLHRNSGFLYNVKTIHRDSEIPILLPSVHSTLSSHSLTSSGCGGIRRVVQRPLRMVEAAFMAQRPPLGPMCGSIYQNNQTNEHETWQLSTIQQFVDVRGCWRCGCLEWSNENWGGRSSVGSYCAFCSHIGDEEGRNGCAELGKFTFQAASRPSWRVPAPSTLFQNVFSFFKWNWQNGRLQQQAG